MPAMMLMLTEEARGRADRFIRDMLDFSHAEAKAGTPQRTAAQSPLDLSEAGGSLSMAQKIPTCFTASTNSWNPTGFTM